MFTYNLKLALRSLQQRKGLTALMIVTIGIGIGLLMTMITIAYQASKVPFPTLADKLYFVQMDSRHADAREVSTWQRMVKLTYQDSINLYNADTVATRQAFNFNVFPILSIEDTDVRPVQAAVDATTSTLFDMFEARFIYGKGWLENEDGAPVIVLTKKINEQLFGGENSVGRQVTIGTTKATVVGVLDTWEQEKRVFDGSFSSFRLNDAFIPYQFALDSNFQRSNWMSCHPQDMPKFRAFTTTDVQGLLASECAWIDFWAQIDNSQDVAKYHDFVDQYVKQQKEYGRFERPLLNMVTNIEQQAKTLRTGRRHEQLTLLAYLFFFVCLVNAVGMLLTKFLASSKQVSLRRALGAKKKVIMTQYLMEVLMIGLLGGLIGIAVSFGGVELMKHVRMYASDYQADMAVLDMAYRLDWKMVATALSVAIGATVAVGLYPIWRIVNISPASQLKGA